MTTATVATSPPSSRAASALRRLYLVRFAFALVWAGLFAATATPVAATSVALLVLYPAFDVAAAVIDMRTSDAGGPSRTALQLNIAISVLAAGALAIVGADSAAILLVWGIWAIVAGGVQLGVGLIRRRVGGQLPMMISGGISVLAGAGFAASSQKADSVTGIAGYAVLGGIFFLVSALRLGRSGRSTAQEAS